MWYERAVAWDEHLQRHPESFVSALRGWRGKEWLIEKRQSLLPLLPRTFNSRLSSLAGVTGTRCVATKPQRRWHDGIDYATELFGQGREIATPWYENVSSFLHESSGH